LGLIGIGQREPADAEVGSEPGPVDLPPARDQDEDVVVRAASNHDGAEQLPELDPLEARALLRRASALGSDDLEGEVRALEGAERGRVVVHRWRAYPVRPGRP